jgi:DHA2 family multidrug resistance protein
MSAAGGSGLEALNGEVTRQASMVGYVDIFHMLLLATLALVPMVVFLRPSRNAQTLAEVSAD